MPFGLKNAPTTFQRLVDQIFYRLSDYVASYIDYVAIFSLSWPEHLVHLEQVFEVLKSAGLTLRTDKCMVGADSCVFLGHHIGGGIVKPLKAKIEAVQSFPYPKTKQDIRAFLGLTGYYRRFIPHYAARTMNLTDALTSKHSRLDSRYETGV